jgi:molybdate transport system substrate-binding protein
VAVVAALAATAICLLALAGCAPSKAATAPTTGAVPAELNVAAASSLADVLERSAPAFEAAHDVKIVFNTGASGVLQKQIEGGAPADVFVSASPSQVDSLVEEGLIAAETTSTFASNDLVIFVPKGNPAGISGPGDLHKAERLVTGNPESAPHGTKTTEWLEGLGLWDALRPSFVFAENAAQTLDYVARGEVDAGIGFGSEAARGDSVETVYVVPKGEIKPVRYVAAPLKNASDAELAAAFVAYLSSDTVQQALLELGFRPPPAQ